MLVAGNGLPLFRANRVASQLALPVNVDRAANALVVLTPRYQESRAREADFTWVDVSHVGTALTLANWGGDDDEGHASVALPWSFPWFGTTYNKVYIDTNGNVGFENWQAPTWNGDNRIPSAGEPNNRIAAFYEDMAGPDLNVCGGEDAVYTYNDAANKRFVVQYNNWCALKDSFLNTFEIILYSDGRVIVQYKNVPSAPPGLTAGISTDQSAVGVEGPGGLRGAVWTGQITDSAAWMYSKSGISGSIYLPFIRR